ncbi:hypothetical protein U14_04124 [Candidatus Moduliflexus flocculans]|uniref:Uncharacterized protein n=1 Tax=Candidatus Moduliflexus flocculans TaxID=1499966 RepID=A0A0S6W461_9BACT|nr:hypothetical protein U14_04124 [Candidatus Moduliflexus flocculans]
MARSEREMGACCLRGGGCRERILWESRLIAMSCFVADVTAMKRKHLSKQHFAVNGEEDINRKSVWTLNTNMEEFS